ITSLDGKGIVDESHPHVLGVLGIFGFPAVAATTQLLRQADVIIAFGVDTIKPFLTDAVNVQRRALVQCESDFVFLTHEYRGDRTLWAAQYLPLRRRQRVIVSSHLGTMGFSLPAAIAAQLAAPERPVVAVCGDGGFQMVVGELATAVQQQLPLVLVIFNNGI